MLGTCSGGMWGIVHSEVHPVCIFVVSALCFGFILSFSSKGFIFHCSALKGLFSTTSPCKTWVFCCCSFWAGSKRGWGNEYVGIFKSLFLLQMMQRSLLCAQLNSPAAELGPAPCQGCLLGSLPRDQDWLSSSWGAAQHWMLTFTANSNSFSSSIHGFLCK